MIFELYAPDDFEIINTVDPKDYEVFNNLYERSPSDKWQPIKIRLVAADKHYKKNRSDFPWLGGPLVIRASAAKILDKILLKNGELLPLIDEEGDDFFVYNAHRINALDEANSTLLKYPNSERIMWLKKPAFFGNIIEGHDLFRLPLRSSATYVNQKFIDKVNDSGLIGLGFKQVWPLPQSSA